MASEYRIINRNNNKIVIKSLASHVAAYLHGLKINDFFIIKTDEKGDRLFDIGSCKNDISIMQIELEKF